MENSSIVRDAFQVYDTYIFVLHKTEVNKVFLVREIKEKHFQKALYQE